MVKLVGAGLFSWGLFSLPMSRRTSGPLIAPDVNAVVLFAQAEEVLGDLFEILATVAASTERVLFVARDRVLKRRVALRVHLQPDDRRRAWFVRETELLAALDHPALRPVYSAGFRGDWAYRASKWIVGESLEDATARGVRPLPSVFQLGRDVISLLEYLHSQRIVVRHIAPATVMIEDTQRAVITDLRYANVCLDLIPAAPPDPLVAPFLAPEIRDGSPGDPGSDIYAAGALLYYAVTGVAPPAEGAIPSPRDVRHACPRALERVSCGRSRPNPTLATSRPRR
jgi:serine/threonine protein kinase